MNNIDIITKEKYKSLLKISLISILFFFLLYNISYIWKFFGFTFGILYPFILGGCLAFIVKIPMNLIEHKIFAKIKKPGLKRGLSLVLSLLVVILAFIFLSVLIVPQIIESMKSFQVKLPIFVDQVLNYLQTIPFLEEQINSTQEVFQNLNWNIVFDKTKEFLFNENSQVFSNAMLTASNIFGKFINSFVAFIFSIYILLDKEKLEVQSKRLLFATFNEKTANYINKIFKLSHYYFFHFIKGQVIDALILGLMVFVGMFALRLPYAVMIAVLTAVLGVIPIVGALLAAFVGIIFILIESPSQALAFTIFILIAQQVESNIVYPKVVGSSISLPSMWTLFAITVGGSLMGIIGMWLFVPIFAIIYTLVGERIEKQLQSKNIKIESN